MFFPSPAPAGGRGRRAGDPAAPGGPARLCHPPGGLVQCGSGCSWWRQWVSAGREGGIGKGLVRRLAMSLGSPAWIARNSAGPGRSAPAPGLDRPPASSDAGRHLLPWSRQLSHQSTVISVGKFQPADAGAGSRAGCAVLCSRPTQRDVANCVFSQQCLGAGRVDMHLPALLLEQVAARCLSAQLHGAAARLPHSSAHCWTQHPS